MGKAKNLIWDEIEYDEEGPPILPLPTETEPVRTVPTQQDLSDAAQASFDAFEVFYADREAGRDTTESHAAYMSAIKLTCDLWFLKNQADLKGAPICSV